MLQPPRHFRHLPAVMGDGEADDFAFDFVERAHVAGASTSRSDGMARAEALHDLVRPVRLSGQLAIIAGDGFDHGWAAAIGQCRRICAATCGNSATPISSPSASTTARKIAFSSWRTLPGQRNAASSASASALRAAHALAFLGGDAGEEMARQRGHVLRPPAQRRHRNRKHVQAVEQVLAETPGLHVGDQVAVGGGDDADVDLDRSCARRPARLRPPARRATTSPAPAGGNSPISSRNSVPPSASTNLPVCFSVAPVKAPFS